MSQQTNSKHKDILSTQITADGNPNKEGFSDYLEQLLERNKIDGTPFYVIGNKDHGYWLVMAKYKLSERFDTQEEVLKHLNTDMWNIIAKLVITLHESINEIHLEKK